MKTTHGMLILVSALSLGSVAVAGCGIDESVYNAALKDRDDQKQKLAATSSDLDREKAANRKDNDARDARILVLENKLPSLGPNASRLETERQGRGAGLALRNERT